MHRQLFLSLSLYISHAKIKCLMLKIVLISCGVVPSKCGFDWFCMYNTWHCMYKHSLKWTQQGPNVCAAIVLIEVRQIVIWRTKSLYHMTSFVCISLHTARKKIAKIDEETHQRAISGFFKWDSDLFKLMTVLHCMYCDRSKYWSALSTWLSHGQEAKYSVFFRAVKNRPFCELYARFFMNACSVLWSASVSVKIIMLASVFTWGHTHN